MQPVVTSWSRRTEDLTCDKTDEKDAVLIARLTAQLRCYEPEPVDETWARLRHLGTRREQLITEAGSQVRLLLCRRELFSALSPKAQLDAELAPCAARVRFTIVAVKKTRGATTGTQAHRDKRRRYFGLNIRSGNRERGG